MTRAIIVKQQSTATLPTTAMSPTSGVGFGGFVAPQVSSTQSAMPVLRSPPHGMISPRMFSAPPSYGTSPTPETLSPPNTPPTKDAAVCSSQTMMHQQGPQLTQWDMQILPQFTGIGAPAMPILQQQLSHQLVQGYDPTFAFATQSVWVAPPTGVGMVAPPTNLLNGVPVTHPPPQLYTAPGSGYGGWRPSASGAAAPPPRQARRKPREYYQNAPDATSCAIMPIEEQNDREFESMRALVCAVAAVLRLSIPITVADDEDAVNNDSITAPSLSSTSAGEPTGTQDPNRSADDDFANCNHNESTGAFKAQTAAVRAEEEEPSDFMGGGRNWSV